MTCPNCSASLDTTPPGQPCPHCGGTRRDVRVDASTALAVSSAFSATVQVGYNKQGSWQQKWMDVEWLIVDLEKLYGKDTVSNVTLRLLAETVLKTCRELADWLYENLPETGLSKSVVIDFIEAHPDLAVCDGFAQISKHNVRRPPPGKKKQDPITAWVVSTESTGLAQIKWENESGTNKGADDALALCKRCVEAWTSYLKGKKLLKPDHQPISTA